MSTEVNKEPVTATREEIAASIAASRSRHDEIMPQPRYSKEEAEVAIQEILALTGATHVHVEHHRKSKVGYKVLDKMSQTYVAYKIYDSRGGETVASVFHQGTDLKIQAHSKCHHKDLFQKKYGYREAVMHLLRVVKEVTTEVA